MSAGSVVIQPDVTFSLASADADISNTPQKVLFVGQMLSGSSAGAGAWEQNIANGGAENALFGRTSQLAEMIRAFKRIAPQVQCDAISLDDNGTTDRVLTSALTGTATEDGTFTITSGSDRLYKTDVAVTSGDAAATVVTAALAAINLLLDCPFTAAANPAGTLEWTADNAGTVANGYAIEITGVVAGLSWGNIAQGTAGATDPVLTDILDAVGTTRYQGIVWPYADIAEVGAGFLTGRFNASGSVLDGVAFVPAMDSHANILTTLAGSTYNNQSIVVLADELTSGGLYFGPAIAESGHLKCTYFAAIRALRLTPDTPISQFVTTSAARDQFGGPALASLPYFNTPFSLLPVPGGGRGFTDVEIEQLHDAGAGILGQNSAGAAAISGEIPTSYLTDPAANVDLTWKYLNYVDTASGAREYLHNNTKARFAQTRLTTGKVQAGRDMANALTIKSFLVKLYNDLSSSEFTLLQAGEAATTFFKDNIVIVLDLALGKATITMKLPIVTQLRTIIATVKIDFDITS